MTLRTIPEFWRRKTLRKRLAECTDAELHELDAGVKEKVATWSAIKFAIWKELKLRRSQKKGVA